MNPLNPLELRFRRNTRADDEGEEDGVVDPFRGRRLERLRGLLLVLLLLTMRIGVVLAGRGVGGVAQSSRSELVTEDVLRIPMP